MALKNLGRGVENFPLQPVGLKQTEVLLPPPHYIFDIEVLYLTETPYDQLSCFECIDHFTFSEFFNIQISLKVFPLRVVQLFSYGIM